MPVKVPRTLSDDDLKATPNLKRLRAANEDVVKSKITDEVLAESTRLNVAIGGSFVAPDDKVAEVARFHAHVVAGTYASLYLSAH